MADPDMIVRERWRHFDRGRADRDLDFKRLRFDLWLAEQQRLISKLARGIKDLGTSERAGASAKHLHLLACKKIVKFLSEAHEAAINDKFPRPDPAAVAEKLGPLGESGYKGGDNGQ